MSWNDDYLLGIPSIDRQHRELITMLGEFDGAILERRSREITGEILARLGRYTLEHFDYEEDLLARYDYPGLDEHRRAHAAMRQRVEDLLAAHGGGRVVPSMELMRFLKNWITTHIMGTDRLYADFLIDEGVE